MDSVKKYGNTGGKKKLTVMDNFNTAGMSRKKSFVPMRFSF